MSVPTDELDGNAVKLDLLVKAIRERFVRSRPAAPLQQPEQSRASRASHLQGDFADKPFRTPVKARFSRLLR